MRPSSRKKKQLINSHYKHISQRKGVTTNWPTFLLKLSASTQHLPLNKIRKTAIPKKSWCQDTSAMVKWVLKHYWNLASFEISGVETMSTEASKISWPIRNTKISEVGERKAGGKQILWLWTPDTLVIVKKHQKTYFFNKRYPARFHTQ